MTPVSNATAAVAFTTNSGGEFCGFVAHALLLERRVLAT